MILSNTRSWSKFRPFWKIFKKKIVSRSKITRNLWLKQNSLSIIKPPNKRTKYRPKWGTWMMKTHSSPSKRFWASLSSLKSPKIFESSVIGKSKLYKENISTLKTYLIRVKFQNALNSLFTNLKCAPSTPPETTDSTSVK